MNPSPEFPTAFRGYEPTVVDQHVAALHQQLQAARAAAENALQEAAAHSVELTKAKQTHDSLRAELDAHARTIAELESAGARAANPTFADLGERVGSILSLADEEATHLRSTAADEVAALRSEADQSAARLRAEAERYAEEVRTKADVDVSAMLTQARAEADSFIDDAAREAAARREEAEAYFEKQRAKAAAAAADFERTLGERREKAAEEFNDQMAKQDAALAAVQERAEQLAREAEADHQARAAEAASALEAAKLEASALVAGAKEQAERIRRDSDRELTAATARRDSITAQLSNVRNMLATLGGGAPGADPLAAIPSFDEEPAEAPAVEDDVQDSAEPTEDVAEAMRARRPLPRPPRTSLPRLQRKLPTSRPWSRKPGTTPRARWKSPARAWVRCGARSRPCCPADRGLSQAVGGLREDGLSHDALGCRADLNHVGAIATQDQHAALAGEFGAPVVKDAAVVIARFGSKADDHRLTGLPAGLHEFSKDVRVAHQANRRRRLVCRTAMGLLDLVFRVLGWTEVGYRGGHDDQIRLLSETHHDIAHLQCRFDLTQGYSVGRRQGCTGHQGDLGAHRDRCGGQGVPLLA